MDAEPLPTHRFAPGDGPWRARGVLVSGVIEYCRHRVPGGLDAVYEAMPPAMRPFFDGSLFLATATYDLSPVVALVHAAARLEGETAADFARARSRASAKQSVEHLYRHQLSAAEPAEMARRLPKIFERFFDPCHAEGVLAEPGRMHVLFSGLPKPMLGFYAWSCEGFVPEALRLSGARDVEYTWDDPRPAGTEHGIPTVDLLFRLAWG